MSRNVEQLDPLHTLNIETLQCLTLITEATSGAKCKCGVELVSADVALAETSLTLFSTS